MRGVGTEHRLLTLSLCCFLSRIRPGSISAPSAILSTELKAEKNAASEGHIMIGKEAITKI